MKKMMMVLVLLLSGFSLVQAEEPDGKKDGPCKDDIKEFCSDVERGDGKIHKCLVDNKEKVDAECKADMEKRKEKMEARKEACEDDVQKYCSKVEKGDGHIRECLVSHKENLTADCQESLKKGKERREDRKEKREELKN